MNDLINAYWWYEVAALFYIVALILSFKTENTYRRIFAMPPIALMQTIPMGVIGFIALVSLYWLSHERLPSPAAVPFAMALGSLVGVYRVDRLLLVIPDRLQIVGALSGVLFLLILCVSGEDKDQILLETLFALAMVALLWGLSYVYLRIRGNIGFGMGDIKLLGWLSLFTGKRMSDLILIAIGFGLLHLLLMTIKNSLASRKLSLPKGQDAFAFGPAIVLAFLTEELIYYG